MIVQRKVNGKKMSFIQPEVRVRAFATGPTITSYIGAIDWYFPKVEKNEHPGVYVGRVARFMREWEGLSLKAACKKYKISYMSLWRIEKGKWQSIKKTSHYLFTAYKLQMDFSFEPKKKLSQQSAKSRKPKAASKNATTEATQERKESNELR